MNTLGISAQLLTEFITRLTKPVLRVFEIAYRSPNARVIERELGLIEGTAGLNQRTLLGDHIGHSIAVAHHDQDSGNVTVKAVIERVDPAVIETVFQFNSAPDVEHAPCAITVPPVWVRSRK